MAREFQEEQNKKKEKENAVSEDLLTSQGRSECLSSEKEEAGADRQEAGGDQEGDGSEEERGGAEEE